MRKRTCGTTIMIGVRLPDPRVFLVACGSWILLRPARQAARARTRHFHDGLATALIAETDAIRCTLLAVRVSYSLFAVRIRKRRSSGQERRRIRASPFLSYANSEQRIANANSQQRASNSGRF